ncbi:hypothetical protein SBV1_820063 [Verrucomicrobia bacterium]|nr:hypothetical protein SBV1_820063 [Verrucomicrobiota bacterium]
MSINSLCDWHRPSAGIHSAAGEPMKETIGEFRSPVNPPGGSSRRQSALTHSRALHRCGGIKLAPTDVGGYLKSYFDRYEPRKKCSG